MRGGGWTDESGAYKCAETREEEHGEESVQFKNKVKFETEEVEEDDIGAQEGKAYTDTEGVKEERREDHEHAVHGMASRQWEVKEARPSCANFWCLCAFVFLLLLYVVSWMHARPTVSSMELPSQASRWEPVVNMSVLSNIEVQSPEADDAQNDW